MKEKKHPKPMPKEESSAKNESDESVPSVPYPDLEDFEQRHTLTLIDPGVSYGEKTEKSD